MKQRIVNLAILIAILMLSILVIWNAYDIKQLKESRNVYDIERN